MYVKQFHIEGTLVCWTDYNIYKTTPHNGCL